MQMDDLMFTLDPEMALTVADLAERYAAALRAEGRIASAKGSTVTVVWPGPAEPFGNELADSPAVSTFTLPRRVDLIAAIESMVREVRVPTCARLALQPHAHRDGARSGSGAPEPDGKP